MKCRRIGLSAASARQLKLVLSKPQQRSFASSITTAGGDSAAVDNGIGNGNGKKVIFSGIQPTGVPHLGNYLGALHQWKRMQDEAGPDTELIFSIVDLHALTMPRERGTLAKSKRDTLAALLAIGLDPQKCTLFYQSMVAQHSELMWILSTTASMGHLARMTQWKSKLHLKDSAELSDATVTKSLKHGLFSYPVLQAADILVYRATHVPVGEDQKQHLELSRECARQFNHTYGGQYLVQPETILCTFSLLFFP